MATTVLSSATRSTLTTLRFFITEVLLWAGPLQTTLLLFTYLIQMSGQQDVVVWNQQDVVVWNQQDSNKLLLTTPIGM